jgi:aminopeptidase
MDSVTQLKYADLLLQVGLNLQPGQNLMIGGEPVHWDFVNVLSKRAYELGARYVDTMLVHPEFSKMRIQHSPEDYLSYFPSYVKAKYSGMVEESFASIRLEGSAFPDLFQDVDQDRNAILIKARNEVLSPFRAAAMSGQVAWCVAGLPTDAWAERVLGTADADALWETLIPILRLDQEDPIATWKGLAEALQRRSNSLNAQHLTRLHFQAPGTDLSVALLEKGSWCGGSIVKPDGEAFVPNLPTEEVFTSPDYRLTSGRAQVTRPVEVLGHEVVGAWFEFVDGVVVDFGADEGQARLEKFFEIDPRAKSLGEIALVDGSSPIFKSGHIFHSILYDENAACHMALGSSYADTFENGPAMSESERYEAGLNQAILHTDFMIGSEAITVTGYDADGKAIPIIIDGQFCEAFA